MSDVSNLTALANAVQGGEAAASWGGDMKNVLQVLGILASVFKGGRMAVNAVSAPATNGDEQMVVVTDPEPVDVPAPVIVVPEPEPLPVPEIVPMTIVVPEIMPLLEAIPIDGPATPVDMPMKEFDEPADVEDPVGGDEPEPDEKHVDEEMSPSNALCDQVLNRGLKRKSSGNFTTFERETLDFDACSELMAPRKTFKLPPVVVVTKMQSEHRIRGLERQYKMSLSRQAVLALRNAAANGPSRIKMLNMEAAEIRREMAIAIECEELLDFCDASRQLAGSRMVKKALATEARLLGQQ